MDCDKTAVKGVRGRDLFLQCLYLSAFTFGGGSTIIALLHKQFVEKLKWIDEAEMLEMVTMAQSAPGATSVNTAVLLGYRLLGPRGALLGLLGTALPPLAVIALITVFYNSICSNPLMEDALRGVRACAAALVASVTLSLLIDLLKERNILLTAVFGFAAVAVLFFDVNSLILIAAGLVTGLISFLVLRKRDRKDKA